MRRNCIVRCFSTHSLSGNVFLFLIFPVHMISSCSRHLMLTFSDYVHSLCSQDNLLTFTAHYAFGSTYFISSRKMLCCIGEENHWCAAIVTCNPSIIEAATVNENLMSCSCIRKLYFLRDYHSLWDLWPLVIRPNLCKLFSVSSITASSHKTWAIETLIFTCLRALEPLRLCSGKNTYAEIAIIDSKYLR